MTCRADQRLSDLFKNICSLVIALFFPLIFLEATTVSYLVRKMLYFLFSLRPVGLATECITFQLGYFERTQRNRRIITVARFSNEAPLSFLLLKKNKNENALISSHSSDNLDLPIKKSLVLRFGF